MMSFGERNGLRGRIKRWRTGWLAVALAGLVSAAATASAQSLAHKGWAGNGLSVAPWWQGAIFYAVGGEELRSAGGDPARDEPGLEERLAGLQEQGVDALVVGGLERGRGQDFDRFVGEATRRRLRVVVDLPLRAAQSGAELAGEARFWLSRGAAGLRLVAGGCEAAAPGEAACASLDLAALEHAVAESSGQRVLIIDLPGVAAMRETTAHRTRRGSRRRSRRAATTTAGGNRAVVDHWFLGWPLLDASGLRRVLAAEIASSGSTGVRLVDGRDARAPLHARAADTRANDEGLGTARRVAAAVLLGVEAPLLSAAEAGEGEAGEIRKWYATLGAIRRGNPAVREGRMELLDAGEANVVAWVRVGRAGGLASPPVLVVENFSDRPVTLHLGTQLRRVGVAIQNGAVLTLATTGEQAGTTAVEALTLEAGGVYVGGLEGQPGLEAAPEPVRRRR